VLAYDISRNGAKIGSVPPASAFVDVSADDGAIYTVTARDLAGNESAPSEEAISERDSEPSALFAEDFACGSLVRWLDVNGLSIEASATADGEVRWIARAHSGIRPAFARVELPDAVTGPAIALRVDLSFRIDEQGDNPAVFFRLRSDAGESLIGVSAATSGALALFDDIASKGAQSARSVSMGEWHHLVVSLSGDPGAVDISFNLDGDNVPDLEWRADWQAHRIGEFQLGDSRPNRVFDLRFRSVAIFGASQRPATPEPAASAAASLQMRLPPQSHLGGVTVALLSPETPVRPRITSTAGTPGAAFSAFGLADLRRVKPPVPP
jgi:hypothetical protein